MPDYVSEGAPLFDYGDLFREVADALKEHGLFDQAYRFYYPIQETSDHADIGYYMAMADCCLLLEMWAEAESYFLTVADNDAKHMESRIELAKLYEELGESEKALKSITEAIRIGREDSRARRRGKDTRLEQLAAEFRAAESGAPLPNTQEPSASLTTYVPSARARGKDETSRLDDAQYLFAKMKALDYYVQGGDEEALEDWLDIADALLRDFRSNRVFYPNVREEFQGYHKRVGKKKEPTVLDKAQEVADRLHKAAGESAVLLLSECSSKNLQVQLRRKNLFLILCPIDTMTFLSMNGLTSSFSTLSASPPKAKWTRHTILFMLQLMLVSSFIRSQGHA